jgi:hypothetical protein
MYIATDIVGLGFSWVDYILLIVPLLFITPIMPPKISSRSLKRLQSEYVNVFYPKFVN